MIPFSGLLQANPFSAPSVGGKPGTPIAAAKGGADHQDPFASSQDASGAFPQWVKKLVDDNTLAAPDGDGAVDLEMENAEADLSAPDSLPAPFAELTEQPPAPEHESRSLDGNGLQEGQAMMPAAVSDGNNGGQDGSQSEDERSRQVWPAPRVDQVLKKEIHAGGHNQSVVDPSRKQMDTIGKRSQHEKGMESPARDPFSSLEMKGQGPMEKGARQDMPVEKTDPQDVLTARAGKEDDPSSFKPVGPAREIEKTSTGQARQQRPSENVSPGQVVSQRPSAGLGVAEKTLEPGPAPGQPHGGNTRASESISGIVADEKTASSEDDTANFQGRGERRQTRKMAFAEVRDAELQKSPSLDSVKGSGAEPIKTDTAFQDTARAVTVEASTTAGSTARSGQASPLSRPEASGAGTFQSSVMDQIVEKASLHSIHGRSEVRIRLKPDFLGNVQMNIATDKEQVVVRITTDQPVVKDIIESHLHHLKAELQHQGLTIDKFEVMVNSDADQQPGRDPFSQMSRNNSFNDGRRQEQDQNPEKGRPRGGNDADDDPDDRPEGDGVNYFA
ncbi:hypothetical protein DSCA_06930 [Desulfosarcina alkanivorans]|uniref:Flagellar hook-length control protein-like C-terminal domain-containing protein n=1 Tax=Desulfosarcina alkanivorans TaxID=571177 RepID=A0A5K7YDP5_9BACT|nr:flagellar hook-length control protein FliK [Desulfosarcina alkanivorans]BBO66763.1 hypothetical protein DSCA_06930 [Desulfosarcina alkanivorans]